MLKRTFPFPVRRKLFAACIVYLLGIYLAQYVCACTVFAVLWSVVFAVWAVFRRLRRKSTLFCILALLLVLGNWRTGFLLRQSDAATKPGSRISGTVTRKVSEKRVYLKDVVVDGKASSSKPVVVTLMPDRDENGNIIETVRTVQIGQRISGTGRLFEPELPRNPGDMDWRMKALCDGYGLSGYILNDWTAEGTARFSILEWIRGVRERLSERIALCFGDQAAFFQAIMVGDKSQMDDMLSNAMRLTGVVHLLTISGVHLSMMAHLFDALFGRLYVSRKVRITAKGVLLAGYTVMTGGAPGTIRALIMAMLHELSRITGRQYDPLNALAAAALMMTLPNPIWALNASFQFSFLVVLGIHLLSSQLFEWLRKSHRDNIALERVANAVALSMSAQFAALPMQLALYGYVPLLALPMNLAAGVMMPVLLAGGWAALAIHFVHQELAKWAAFCPVWIAAGLGEACAWAAEISWGIVRLPAPTGLALITFIILMLALSSQFGRVKHRSRLCICVAAVLLVLYIPRFDPTQRYVQLDVGQGDAAVLRSGREAVLIDVGPEDAYAALRYLRHEGLFVRLIVLSHLDVDHAGALGLLLDSEIGIERIAMAERATEYTKDEAILSALLRAQEEGIELEMHEQGDTFTAAGFAFSVHSPNASISGSNERSLVLSTQIGDMRLLTLGDLPADCEPEWLPESDIIKVAHHGSRYATSRTLLEQVEPEIAIISVGANPYGHPTDRVLEDLYELGVQVFRTDETGAVTVWPKNGEMSVQTFIQ